MTPKMTLFDTLKSEVSKKPPENNREGPKRGQKRGQKRVQKWPKSLDVRGILTHFCHFLKKVKKTKKTRKKGVKKTSFFDFVKNYDFSRNIPGVRSALFEIEKKGHFWDPLKMTDFLNILYKIKK